VRTSYPDKHVADDDWAETGIRARAYPSLTVSAWPSPLLPGIEIAAYRTFVERMNAAGVQIFLQ
jgi:hypothetical protein